MWYPPGVGIAVIVLLALLVLVGLNISGALGRIAGHNEKFTPPPEEEPGLKLSVEDVFVLRAFGGEQVCTVKGIAQHKDGYLVVAAEPVGSTS